jgi:hypothetical protein
MGDMVSVLQLCPPKHSSSFKKKKNLAEATAVIAA